MSKFLTRNLIIAVIPYYIFLGIIFFTMHTLSGMDSYKVYEAANYEDAFKQYKDNKVNFELTIEDVKYSGFDYVLDDVKLGSYYYTFDGKNIRLYVLTDATAKKIQSQKGTRVRVSAVYDESVVSYFVKEYAAVISQPADDLEKMCSPIIMSEPAYPTSKLKVLDITRIAIVIILLVLTIYVLVAAVFPSLNILTKKLVRKTGIRNVLRKATREMKLHLLYHDKNVYITEKYMIVIFPNKIDIIVLDDIKYMSKRSEKKNSIRGRENVIYRLSISNADDFYYEYIFEDEDVVDNVVKNIRGVEADEEVEEKRASYEIPEDVQAIIDANAKK